MAWPHDRFFRDWYSASYTCCGDGRPLYSISVLRRNGTAAVLESPAVSPLADSVVATQFLVVGFALSSTVIFAIHGGE